MAKVAARLLRLLGRGGTHTPARIAVAIDPHFCERIVLPSTIVGVTGTNGKTTVTNMVSNVLSRLGIPHAANLSGSNLREGVITAIIAKLDWRGRSTVDLGVFEIDEISAKTLFPFLKPTLIAVTVLFRDSYARNAHTDFISALLNDVIPEESRLLLNGDDLIGAALAPANERRYFSVEPLPDEVEETADLINDLALCPTCQVPLEYTFHRYHHLGRLSCRSCGLTNPASDYIGTLHGDGSMTVEATHLDEISTYRAIGYNITDMYNETLAIAILREIGLKPEQINDALSGLKIKESRFEEETFGKRHLISIMGKDQNPVATTRALSAVGSLKDIDAMCVLIINESIDLLYCPENLAYVYDVNVEYLDKSSIHLIGVASDRRYDYLQRLELAGFPEEKLISAASEAELAKMIDVSRYDTIVLITGTSNAKGIAAAKKILRAKLRACM